MAVSYATSRWRIAEPVRQFEDVALHVGQVVHQSIYVALDEEEPQGTAQIEDNGDEEDGADMQHIEHKGR